MIEIHRGDTLGESYRRGMSEVFVDGFGEYLEYFSKDRSRLVDAMAHILVLDMFYVALVDGKPGAIAACTDGVQLSVRIDRRQMRRHLGMYRGTLAGLILRHEFEKPWEHPVPGTASIEFVATGSAFRGQGVATTLLRHLLTLPQYDTYVLEEVADTNAAALGLYRKLGFEEYKRKPVRHTKRTGIHEYVWMRLVQG